MSRNDMAIVGNAARYQRRGLPQKTNLPYAALGHEDRVRVNKLAALLRLANALDAEHLQKVRDLRVDEEDGGGRGRAGRRRGPHPGVPRGQRAG